MGYKISIGSNIIEGPWGGGNQFARSLSRYLKDRGWRVTTGLTDGDIDLILMTEPRLTSRSGVYNQKQISRYLVKKPDTVVVHRINECDERKQSRGVNKYLMRANKVADYTIFISGFLRNLFIKKGFFKGKNSAAVKNGADAEVFNRTGLKKWNHRSPLKIVTHHWGYSYNKGFDIYEKLGTAGSTGSIKIKFSYIGRIPEGVRYEGINIIPPLSGRRLVQELKSNHVYITGSVNEPAGMHHIEGAMCGLPLLYRNSGALPEYCSSFGIMFKGTDDFEDKLKELIDKYDYYFDKMKEYPFNADVMCRKYEEIFLDLLRKKDKFNLDKRRFKYTGFFIKEILLQPVDIVFFKLRMLIKKVFNGYKEKN